MIFFCLCKKKYYVVLSKHCATYPCLMLIQIVPLVNPLTNEPSSELRLIMRMGTSSEKNTWVIARRIVENNIEPW